MAIRESLLVLGASILLATPIACGKQDTTEGTPANTGDGSGGNDGEAVAGQSSAGVDAAFPTDRPPFPSGGFSGAGGSVDSAGASAGGAPNESGEGGRAGSPAPCGPTPCPVGQTCIVPACCQGAGPPCNPLPDSGTCPANSYPYTCPGSQQPGCQERPCQPEAPHCVALPSGCGDSPNCECASELCPQAMCNSFSEVDQVLICGCR